MRAVRAERPRPVAAAPRAGARTAALFALLVEAGGCGPTSGVSIDPIADVSAPVGEELVVAIHAGVATESETHLTFDVSAPDLPDLTTRMLPATLTTYARGEAVFRWTPLATDLALDGKGVLGPTPHEIDLTAHAAGVDTHTSFLVTVVPAADTAPVFREPAGEGTTLALARGPCVTVAVQADDADQPRVDLSLAPPLVDNATLTQEGPLVGTLTFCPTADQVARSTIFVLILAADDGTHQVRKPYTIVVRPVPVAGCSTQPPTVTAAPHGDSMATGTLQISATIADDVGVASARVLWSTQAPSDPAHPDLSRFTVATMKRTSGDASSGKYQAVLPSPVAGMAAGTTARVYYVIDASDADPPAGCAHETFAPAMGVWSFQVKHP